MSLRHPVCNSLKDMYNSLKYMYVTARCREDETRNARRNANRNPEWWGDCSQLVKIEKLNFCGILRYKFELRFWLNLNSYVSRCTLSNPDFGLNRNCSWLKSLPPFRILICIPTSISNLIFSGTGCMQLTHWNICMSRKALESVYDLLKYMYVIQLIDWNRCMSCNCMLWSICVLCNSWFIKIYSCIRYIYFV